MRLLASHLVELCRVVWRRRRLCTVTTLASQEPLGTVARLQLPRRLGCRGIGMTPLAVSLPGRRPCVHPDNVWSLHGLYQCLQRTGKTAEAAVLR